MRPYERPKIIYRCDPSKNKGCKKTSCYISGGMCECTSDKTFAALDGYGKPIVDAWNRRADDE